MLNDLRTLHVAVLCSKRAPGLAALLHHPLRGRIYELGCVITTESYLPEEQACERARVPVVTHPIRDFYRMHNAPLRDGVVRALYDRTTADVLGRLRIDVVLMLGYLYIVTAPLLAAFPERVFSIHDSDLALRRADGSPRYPGLHATRDAIVAGENETRSTLHVVTEKLDDGPVVVRSQPYAVAPFAREAADAGESDIVKAYAYAQREWMMRSAWGTMALRALELVAAGVGLPNLPLATARGEEAIVA